MQTFDLENKTDKKILALGAELDSAFAFCIDNKIVISKNTKETANNPILLEKKINEFIKASLKPISTNIPDCILTDLNPEYNTFKIGEKLTQKWQIPHIKIQHHTAHIFSVITEHYLLEKSKDKMPDNFIGIACDGTGYGTDETIWGGEVFQIPNSKFQIPNINRIGHLEKQTLIGGQMAVEEPARMLMAILANLLDEQKTYEMMNEFYDPKISKLLYSQLRQNFNCQKTSSCARVLDAASALLFGCNQRKFKHQAAKILEDNSSEPYDDIQPIITKTGDNALRGSLPQGDSRALSENNISILQTTPLFEYLIKNLDRDKKRLAATVHHYIANGLLKIVRNKNLCSMKNKKEDKIIFSGGMANNKIFQKYFKEKNALLNEQIEPGDPGISFGQIGWYLVNYQF